MMAEKFSYEMKIPEERVGVLIGASGKTKKRIEEMTQCTLDISQEGDVIISGSDAVLLYTAREIIRAIARGFNPTIALLLLKPDYMLEVIDISDYAGKSKKARIRIKSRLIGTKGKAQKEIERLANVDIAIYGKTISMIGLIDDVQIARQAVEMLIRGSMHKTVYRFLEKKRKEMII
jgi:ribosomal RNA assembly protein